MAKPSVEWALAMLLCVYGTQDRKEGPLWRILCTCPQISQAGSCASTYWLFPWGRLCCRHTKISMVVEGDPRWRLAIVNKDARCIYTSIADLYQGGQVGSQGVLI